MALRILVSSAVSVLKIIVFTSILTGHSVELFCLTRTKNVVDEQWLGAVSVLGETLQWGCFCPWCFHPLLLPGSPYAYC